jgi:hypothetical protein
MQAEVCHELRVSSALGKRHLNMASTCLGLRDCSKFLFYCYSFSFIEHIQSPEFYCGCSSAIHAMLSTHLGS